MPPRMKAVLGLYSLAAVALVAGVTTPACGASQVWCIPNSSVTSTAPAQLETTAFDARAADPAVSGHLIPAPRGVVRPASVLAADGYSAMVRRIARRHSVEWKLVMAIIASESGGNAMAVSPAGAVGLMQLMPDTASALGVDPWDPEQNVEGAVRYLSSLLSTFGSVDLTLVAYNAGPGFAKRYRDGGVELCAETRAFLMRVGERLN
jgi:soluble lytic murein transglycosylase-like protein